MCLLIMLRLLVQLIVESYLNVNSNYNISNIFTITLSTEFQDFHTCPAYKNNEVCRSYTFSICTCSDNATYSCDNLSALNV